MLHTCTCRPQGKSNLTDLTVINLTAFPLSKLLGAIFRRRLSMNRFVNRCENQHKFRAVRQTLSN